MSTSLQETFTRLVDVASDLMVPLRLGREADPLAADALKGTLQELRESLRDDDSVPKPVSRFLVELYPLLLSAIDGQPSARRPELEDFSADILELIVSVFDEA